MGCCDSKARQEVCIGENTGYKAIESPIFDGSRRESISFSKKNITKIHSGKITKHYKIVSKVHHAGIGLVYQGRSLVNNQAVLIKRISRWCLNSNEKKSAQDLQHLPLLDHPNLIKIYEIIEDQDFLYVISEFCSGGTLLKQLRRKRSFEEVQIKTFISQILYSLSYCHNNGVIHGNIDAERLFFETISSKAVLKLIDIGLDDWENSRQKRHDISYLQFRSPETLQGRTTAKSDIWSLGVLMYMMLSGDKPFKGQNADTLVNSIMRGEYSFDGLRWRLITSDAKQVISRMLQVNPNLRPTAQEILELDWFKSCSDQIKTRKNSLIFQGLEHKMHQFQVFSELSQAVTLYVTNKFATENEVNDLRILFNQLDSDNNGILTLEELLDGSQKIGHRMSREEVLRLFNQIDLDQSGSIEYSEFLTATLNQKSFLHQKRLEEAFRAIDTDGSGTIDFQELQSFFQAVDERIIEYLKQAITKISSNGSGEISFEDFVAAITND